VFIGVIVGLAKNELKIITVGFESVFLGLQIMSLA
jgi:hypothetical protein